MPSYRISVSPRARKDLVGIGGPATGPSPAPTSPMLDKIFAAFDRLKQTPNRNVVFPQPATRQPPVRSLPVVPYIVYFRVYDDEKVVRVTRVRHGSRRPLKRFD